MRIIVGGFLGLVPSGGLTWHYLQYPLGFAALGCDVYYVEDTRIWPVYHTDAGQHGDCSASVAHLAAAMQAFGLSDRWAYRDEASGHCFGMSEQRVSEVCASADVFINVSCSTYMREAYRNIPVRVLIDTDPMFTQVQCETEVKFTPGAATLRDLIDEHTHHFTFGESIGREDCRVPSCGVAWRPTRQPICLEHWPASDATIGGNAAYTTVMNWSAAPPLHYANESWGQKNEQFRAVMDLPSRVADIRLAVAVGQTTKTEGFPEQAAAEAGWSLLDPWQVAPNWHTYRDFIHASRGEVSVAKDAYVKARTGWFSERSACYLAAGRPVITQDTGWTDHLPSGSGLIGFDDLGGCVDAIRRVEQDYAAHATAARRLAQEYFASDRVLEAMLKQVGG